MINDLTADGSRRQATTRRYLMCPPEHFTVTYAINPWMRPDQPTDTALALRQWAQLRDVYVSLGHDVRIIEPVAGLPDMVFAANGATVVAARFWAPASGTRSGPMRAPRTWTGSGKAATR